MLPKRSLRVGLLFALVAAGPVCPAHAQDKNAELRQLLKERCDSLEFAEKRFMALYTTGNADISLGLPIQRDLFQARLELCTKADERIDVLKGARRTAEILVAVAEQRLKVGTARDIDLHLARAALLEVRIELLRTEMKQAPPK